MAPLLEQIKEKQPYAAKKDEGGDHADEKPNVKPTKEKHSKQLAPLV